MRPLAVFGTVLIASVAVHAGTLDDMELRSNVEASIRGTAQTAVLHLKIRVEQGIAIPEGIVRDLNQADQVVELASRVNGITGVDRSGLRLEFPAAGDDVLAARVSQRLSEMPHYTSSAIQVAADHGIVTLTGTLTNASWRQEIRKLCGAIEGVFDLVDRLDSPPTSDDRIQKALDRVFSPRAAPRFPGRVRAVARDGVVTLEGLVPRLYDKQTAAREARAFNGVRRVDNRLELGSTTAIRVIDP